MFSTALSVLASFANASDLYLLAGTVSNSGIDLPVRLYRVDSPKGTLILERDIASGMNCVLADHPGRRLVIASPALDPTVFSFINMDSPRRVVTQRLPAYTNDSVAGRIYLLDLPNVGPGLALTIDRLNLTAGTKEYASFLTFKSLKPSDIARPLPFDNLKYMRVSGDVGGALAMAGNRVIVRGDPPEIAVGSSGKQNGRPLTGFARPPYLNGRDPREGSQVAVADSRRIVLVPTDPGVVDVLDEKTNEWRRIPVPFRSSLVRGFGTWAALIETQSSAAMFPPGKSTVRKEDIKVAYKSPGEEKRRSEELLPSYRNSPAITVDDLFNESYSAYVAYLAGTVMEVAEQQPDRPGLWVALMNSPYDPGSKGGRWRASHGDKTAQFLLSQARGSDPYLQRADALLMLAQVVSYERDPATKHRLSEEDVALLDETVRSGLEDPDEGVRYMAIMGLGLIGKPEDVATLERIALTDPRVTTSGGPTGADIRFFNRETARDAADQLRKRLKISDGGAR